MTFKAFAFEGAGTTAFAHQGAIEIFYQKGYLNDIQFFSGSSSGAFLAAALGCGATSHQTRDILNNTDFSKFLDDSPCVVKDFYRLFKKFAWFKGEEIENWYGGVLETITGNSEITFKEAYDLTGKTIVITTTDLTVGEVIYMSHQTTPNLKIKTAIRRTTALPFLFKPDTPIETIDIFGEEKEIKRCYVDGGLLDNYPLHYFDDKLDSLDQMVGFKTMTNLELNEMINPYIDPRNPTFPKSLNDFLMRFLIMIINKNFKIHIPLEDWDRTVRIDTDDHSSIDFSISDEDSTFMLEQGRKAALEFLERKNLL